MKEIEELKIFHARMVLVLRGFTRISTRMLSLICTYLGAVGCVERLDSREM